MKNEQRTLSCIGFCIARMIVLLSSGVLIAHLLSLFYWLSLPEGTEQQKFHNEFIKQVSNQSLSSFLRELTKAPHVSGSLENFATANYVLEQFQNFGISAEYADYDVLLSSPLHRSLSLSFPNGSTLAFSLQEEPVEGDPSSTCSSRIVPPFLAYSPSGTVTGEVVYANYGQKEDFQTLKAFGVDVRGSIVIARLGKSFRGDIVFNAENEVATAVVLYSDPQEYGANGTEGYYPHSQWLPPSGVQRGSIYLRAGDPLTPGWASTKDAERLNISDPEVVLPKIPALPISAQDALSIISALEGPVAPAGWKGGLLLDEYHLGKGPAKLHLSYLVNETVTGIRNVIGVITGEEKDRYVLLGNHRDAWTFGAADPNSGTASLLEIARIFGELLKLGWKPKRTIILCSWDAEEDGLIGSTEWVEDNLGVLNARAVVYLNVDVAVSGGDIEILATPQIDNLFREVTKMVNDPNRDGVSVFNTWCKNTSGCPIFRLGGGGSDYAAFLQHAGIAAAALGYTSSTRSSGYPVYHSSYDNYNWMEKFGDPSFKRHCAVSRIWGLLALRLADDLILPFDYMTYANVLEESVKEIAKNLKNTQVSTSPMFSALGKLRRSAAMIELQAQEAKLKHRKHNVASALQSRLLNDQLILAERAFLDADGLPGGKSWYKHLVYGPSETDVYGTEAFPAITGAITKLHSQEMDKGEAVKQIQHEVWRAARAINQAAKVLQGNIVDVTSAWQKPQ